MRILGIESSCDDTSVALLDCSEQGCFILSEKTASQIEIHKKYGGVVPEIAGRMHAEKIVPLIEEVLSNTPPHPPSKRVEYTKPDIIAVTTGPGLVTGLIVGAEAARALSYAWDIPVVAVNHLEGHIHSVEILNPKPETLNKSENTKQYPISNNQYLALALIARGAHTSLIYIEQQGVYKILGKTVDDAAGECFDKVAKLLDLPYPGGPQISKLALTGNTKAIQFPRPMLKEKIDFSAKGGPAFGWSFSGLKTSALYWLKDNTLAIASEAKQSPSKPEITSSLTAPRNDITINDFCASFEQAIVDVLVGKTIKAVQEYNPKTVILAGGVSANKKLRETLKNELATVTPHSLLLTPSLTYCMDNASMIAVAGYYQALKNNYTDWRKIIVDPNWKLA